MRISFIGLGHLNSAILAGLSSTEVARTDLRATTQSEQTAQQSAEEFGIEVLATQTDPDANRKTVADADLVVLGVKPKDIVLTAQELAPALSPMTTVVSVAAGITRLGWSERPTSIHKLQAAAAVGQSSLVQTYEQEFQNYNITAAQILLDHDDLSNRQRYLNARSTIRTLMQLRVIPIVNENDAVATDEIRFGDNDRLAALVTTAVAGPLAFVALLSTPVAAAPKVKSRTRTRALRGGSVAVSAASTTSATASRPAPKAVPPGCRPSSPGSTRPARRKVGRRHRLPRPARSRSRR